ncbi:MAG TPA: Uma2 family endonuclease [Bryobacteraceae bacterium]|jgi:Uma2 family endonuclease|nr:Uma2 family endonuclease [Bryobacteraceae bacterium]
MAATTLLTSDQFLAMPEEFDQHGNRIKDELIGGEVVKMPPASLVHDLIKNRIHELLIEYLHANPELGLKSLVEIGTQVSNADAFIPDVSVVKRSRLPGAARVFQGSPDLAIEVVSPSDTAKHLERKVDAYLQGGAKSVWVVFPEARSVRVHALDSVQKFKADQSIEDPLLPGFSNPVASFFELT